MRLVAYIRVSQVRGREGESFISPLEQRDRIAGQAAASAHAIVEWLEDLDEPGSRYARPGFQRALGMIEAGEADGMIVFALDRFARSTHDAAMALRRIRDAGATLIAVRDALDTSTPIGRFGVTMMLAIAELELERIRENWRVATRRAVERGVHVSGRVAFGYRRGEDGLLVVDEAEAQGVRDLFAMRSREVSWHLICAHLDATCPRQGAWTHQRLDWMIRNRVYLGEARQGDLRNADAHEAIVTREEWEAAQSRGVRRSWRGVPSLLSGIARCGSCGYALTRNWSRPDFPVYGCGKRRAQGVCAAPVTIGAARLEAHVEEVFLEWARAEAVVFEGVPVEERLADALAALEQAETELAAYRSTNLVSVLGPEQWAAGISERAEAVRAAQVRVVEVRSTAPLPTTSDVVSDWPGLDHVERRALIASVIRCVLVHRLASRSLSLAPVAERVTIVWVGDDLSSLPGLAN